MLATTLNNFLPFSIFCSKNERNLHLQDRNLGLDTYFNRIVFRSKTEAMWAVFLSKLKIEYCYEPRKFALASGHSYIPDFWIPSLNIWIEIKCGVLSEEEKVKIKGLHELEGKPVYVLNGFPLIDRFYDPFNESQYTWEIMGFDILNHNCSRISNKTLMRSMVAIFKPKTLFKYEENHLINSMSFYCATNAAHKKFKDYKHIREIVLEMEYGNKDEFIRDRHIIDDENN